MSAPLSHKRFYIVDADFLLTYLGVPGFERAGSDEAPITHEDAARQIESLKAGGETLVLPTSVIVEAGNHITNAKREVQKYARAFAEVIRDSIDSKEPWAAYDETPNPDANDFLRELAKEWAAQAEHRASIGDMAVRHVVKHYRALGSQVYILTGDQTLGAHSDPIETSPPRRRQRR